MGVGSQRAGIEHDDVRQTFHVRDVAPDVLLFANLGAVQFNYGYTVDQCRRAVEMIDADALILHLNPLQEAVQPEGDVNWRGLLDKIADVCARLGKPVIVKEVGWGISAQTARRLIEAGVSAIDVAGAGGTSWSQVEMHRAPTERLRRLAGAFADWGIPTAESLVTAALRARRAGPAGRAPLCQRRHPHRPGYCEMRRAGRRPGRAGVALPQGGHGISRSGCRGDGTVDRRGAHRHVLQRRRGHRCAATAGRVG